MDNLVTRQDRIAAANELFALHNRINMLIGRTAQALIHATDPDIRILLADCRQEIADSNNLYAALAARHITTYPVAPDLTR